LNLLFNANAHLSFQLGIGMGNQRGKERYRARIYNRLGQLGAVFADFT